MNSRVQLHHFYLMTWLKTLLKSNGLTDEFFSQPIKSQLYTEKLNFDFLVKIKCQRSQFVKACQNMKLIHQEIKKSRFHFEKSKFLNLEFFLSFGNFMFFHNFEPNFHHDAG